MGFQKLINTSTNTYKTYSKKKFNPIAKINKKSINQLFEFAYKMTYANKGAHRSSRSGGQKNRKKGEIFCNTFQGKLAEIGVNNYFRNNNIQTSGVDFRCWELGRWDQTDIEVKQHKINIKSIKFFSDLLLLETADWDKEGRYIPNFKNGGGVYDFFVLVRIKPSIENVFKQYRNYYSTKFDPRIKDEIFARNWLFDIPGYLTREDLVYLVAQNFILPQNASLNRTTKMDAENYYCQSGDMKPIEDLIRILKN
jgi:hypothetical protein